MQMNIYFVIRKYFTSYTFYC